MFYPVLTCFPKIKFALDNLKDMKLYLYLAKCENGTFKNMSVCDAKFDQKEFECKNPRKVVCKENEKKLIYGFGKKGITKISTQIEYLKETYEKF